ncbi:MAG: type VI secretion system baseplate subunit TssE [Desulfobacterales bacterium]
MAELTPAEKLQPCLLDRLTDHEPNKKQESRGQRVMSMRQYRQAVLRDLAWLLNTYAHREDDGLEEFEQVPSSVLNFGVQNLTGLSASSLSVDDMRYQLTEAIQRFEPRIIPNSISIIMAVDPEEMSNRSIRFEIRGDLWTQPIPESLYIKTEIDLETGQCDLNRGASG